MSYTIKWIIEDYVFYVDVNGDSSIEDMTEVNNIAIKMMESSPAERLHLIIDSTNSKKEPSIFAQNKILTSLVHKKCGWVVDVTNNNVLMGALNKGIALLKHLSYQSADSIEDALQFLKSQDEKIPEL